jgi:hypothetical protein
MPPTGIPEHRFHSHIAKERFKTGKTEDTPMTKHFLLHGNRIHLLQHSESAQYDAEGTTESIWQNTGRETIRRDLARLEGCPMPFLRILMQESGASDVSRFSDDEILTQIAARIERGAIRAIPCDCILAPVRLGANPPDTTAPAAVIDLSRTKKTWVEVCLIDSDGDPVANESYKLTLVDGRILTGKLNDKGVLRVNGIDPGTCELSFPDLPAVSWQAA